MQSLRSYDDFVRVKGDFFEESIAKVYRRYQQLLMKNNAVDNGDLIRLSVQLLRQNPGTLEFYQALFRYVSVDEFQDTSFAQYQLVRHQNAKEVFVCEGPMDWLTLVEWGYPAVALLGSHLKQDQISEVADAEQIFIVTDSDEAGRKSARQLAEIFGRRSRIVPPLPNVKDVNELAMKPKGKRCSRVWSNRLDQEFADSDISASASPENSSPL